MTNFSIYAGLAGAPSTPGDLAFMNSKARAAKALFTTPKATAPWTIKAPETPLLAQANAIARSPQLLRLASSKAGSPGDPDVSLSFNTYGALDKLLTLAKASAEGRTDSATRSKLADSFDRGLSELQDFLASTHGAKLNVGFNRLKSSAETTKVTRSGMETVGRGVSTARADPVAGLTGTERIAVTLSKGGRTDTVVADLSSISGPVTLDALSSAVNSAIKSVPLLAADGSVVLDGDGNAVSRYLSAFEVTKGSDNRWGLTLKGLETEQVALSDPDAKSTLVVTGGLATGSDPSTGRVFAFEDPTAGLSQRTLAELTAQDADATQMATRLAQAKADAEYDKKVADANKLRLPTPPRPPDATATVLSSLAPKATATDKFGNIFVVGTTAGDIGQQRNDGVADLFLSKLDADGQVLWQRLIGSEAATSGAAIAVDANGDVVVAGTTDGSLTSKDQLDGADSFVAKFRGNGDEVFTTQIDGAAIDEANSVAIDGTGRIFLAGTVRGALPGQVGSGGRDAYIYQLDTTGQVTAKRQVGSTGDDSLASMALDGNGTVLLALRRPGGTILQRLDAGTLADGGSLDLGDVHVKSVAVDSATGRIAVGGAASADVNGGTQVNARGGLADGFVMLVDRDFSNGVVRYLGTASNDTVDSVAFLDGKLFAGGRTGASLNGPKVGVVDGFLARLDLAGGLEQLRQFGRPGASQESIQIAASEAGSSVLSRIGLRAGDQRGATPTKLVGQTSLREGDHFFLKLEGRKVRIDIKLDDSFETLAARIRVATFNRIKATTSSGSQGTSLRLAVRSGVSVDVLSGADGHDALPKIGLAPTRLYVAKSEKGANIIQPGGTFALDLDGALNIKDKQSAGFVVKKLETAVRTIQSAFRSLYWDETKARIASGIPATPAFDARATAQVRAYQAALARLGG